MGKEWSLFDIRANTVAFGLIHTRCVCLLLFPFFILINPMYFYTFKLISLTASKEAGASIKIEGKKKSLLCPRRATPCDYSASTRTLFFHFNETRRYFRRCCCISVLLYVSYVINSATDFQYNMSTTWLHVLLGVLWKLQVVVSKKKRI